LITSSIWITNLTLSFDHECDFVRRVPFRSRPFAPITSLADRVPLRSRRVKPLFSWKQWKPTR
jgi:hypothetical protein